MIGTIRADNIDDPASLVSIAQGAITGDGLLGELAKAIQRLDHWAQMYGYVAGESDARELHKARQAVFDVMKKIEKTSTGV